MKLELPLVAGDLQQKQTGSSMFKIGDYLIGKDRVGIIVHIHGDVCTLKIVNTPLNLTYSMLISQNSDKWKKINNLKIVSLLYV